MKHVYIKFTANVHSNIIYKSQKNWKQAKSASPGILINKIWYIHKVEDRTEIKRNDILMHATRW